MRYLSLAAFLFVFWLALSGHYTPFLIVAGVLVAGLCVLAAVRMRIADEEGHPVAQGAVGNAVLRADIDDLAIGAFVIVANAPPVFGRKQDRVTHRVCP